MAAAGRLAGGDPAEAQGAGRGPPRPGRRRRAASWKDGTSGTVPLPLEPRRPSCPARSRCGPAAYASLGDILLKPWLSDSYTITEPRITYYVNSDDTWHLDLWWRQRDLGAAARIAALELTIECVAVFADVPQSPRARPTFTTMLHRVLDDPVLRTLHEDAAWDVIAKTWREQVCTEEDAQVFSEGRGWTSQLVWSLSGLDAAHEVLSRVVSRAQTVDEVIASMALHDEVDELPAALAAAAGSERFAAINAAFERLRPGYDGDDWMADNRGWLARGMVNRRDRRGPAVAGDGHPGRRARRRAAVVREGDVVPEPHRLPRRPDQPVPRLRPRW